VAFRRIVGLGLCVLDQLLLVDDFSLPVRARYRERAVLPGGMVTTALAQAARLGCRTELLSVVGDDAEGRRLVRDLRRLGVGTRRLLRDPRHDTSAVTVLVERRKGERRFVLPQRRALERSAPDFDLAAIDRRSLLLVDGHFPRNALRGVRRAREVGAPVIADLCEPRPAFLRLLPYVDYPIVPLEFVQAWGRGGARESLHALRDEFGGTPVVTLGRRGALALVGGRVHRIPARRVRVRDTTGAGDVFHGAFAAGLYQGRGVLESLALASRAAAWACTALGGTARLLDSAD
jgi:sulfofructose kinase